MISIEGSNLDPGYHSPLVSSIDDPLNMDSEGNLLNMISQ